MRVVTFLKHFLPEDMQKKVDIKVENDQKNY